MCPLLLLLREGLQHYHSTLGMRATHGWARVIDGDTLMVRSHAAVH